MTTPIPEVPWMVEGGAKHTVQIARNVSYMAAGGTEGIVRGADCEIRETAVPGSTVRMFPGTVAVLNRAAGAKDEMYVARVGAETEVPIAPTDASGPRSDLIVLRIENPYASGETWPDPTDPTVGPYASLAVISNVPASTNSVDDLGLTADHSMLALARVDLPISTGTVTQAEITDLRVMANAVNKRTLDIIEPTASDTLSSAGYTDWPGEVDLSLDVPEWATHCRLRAIFSGVLHGGVGTTNVVGDLRFQIGGSGGDFFSSASRYDLDNDGGAERSTLMVTDGKVALPTADRGRRGVPFRIEGRKTGGDDTISVDTKTSISFEVEFINEPESNI